MQCNPRPDGAAARGDRRRRSSTMPRRCRSSTRFADDAAFQRALRRRQARQQGASLRNLIAARMGIKLDPAALFDVQIKRIHEYKRQLLNIIETVALYDADPLASRAGLGAARQDLRRQGGAELSQAKLIIKLANDVAAGGQQRSRRARPAEGRVRAELQCQPGRNDRSGRRPVGADFDGRHGSLGHRQHEVRAQRRAHHRHARRRQCRDHGARRRRQHLHLRPDGRRSRGAARARATIRAP